MIATEIAKLVCTNIGIAKLIMNAPYEKALFWEKADIIEQFLKLRVNSRETVHGMMYAIIGAMRSADAFDTANKIK